VQFEQVECLKIEDQISRVCLSATVEPSHLADLIPAGTLNADNAIEKVTGRHVDAKREREMIKSNRLSMSYTLHHD